MQRFWFRTRRFLARKVLHTDDTPHAIALGAALAMFVTFLPLIGLQTVISIGLAALFRANKAICIPIVWITNPFTAGPIYTGCLLIGRFFLPSRALADQSAVLVELEKQQQLSILDAGFWTDLLEHLAGWGLALWVGCMIVGAVGAIISYGLSRWGVTVYRERRRQRQLRRSLLRSQVQAARVAK